MDDLAAKTARFAALLNMMVYLSQSINKERDDDDVQHDDDDLFTTQKTIDRNCSLLPPPVFET